MVRREVTTWYLEMHSPDELRSVACPNESARLVRAEIPSPELSRFLYTAVGGPWYCSVAWNGTSRAGWLP